MGKDTIELVAQAVKMLEVGGPYVFVLIEGIIIWKLWKTNEALHTKFENSLKRKD